MYLQAVAEHLGLGATDFTCLSLIGDEGPLTPGALVARVGLTSGAITGVVDRLERVGWVRREPDPGDRRRVRVAVVPERQAELRPYYAPMAGATEDVLAGFNPAERRTLARYLARSRAVLEQQTLHLRAQDWVVAGVAGDALTAPLGTTVEGHLRLVGLSAMAQVRGTDLGADLFRIDAVGPAPAVDLSRGRLTVSGRRGLRRRRAERLTIAVNSAIPWTIEVSGGASRLSADLAALELRSLTISGGASRLEIHLPPPSGRVPVRVTGGTSRIDLHRPAGVPASLRIRGGASSVTFDGSVLGAIGGELRLTSDGFAAAGDAYEVELTGGASRITLDAAG